MNIKKNLTSINRTKFKDRKIKYIVIHYFGDFGTAKNTCAYFKDVDRKSSAHYFVDDTDIYQCVEDKDASWHCGGDGPGKYQGFCTNANSIGIEMRPYKMNTKSKSIGDNDWYFHDKTVENTVELTRYLMKKYNLDKAHVIRHYDVTTKKCPRPFVGTDKNAFYNKTGRSMWDDFIKRLIK